MNRSCFALMALISCLAGTFTEERSQAIEPLDDQYFYDEFFYTDEAFGLCGNRPDYVCADSDPLSNNPPTWGTSVDPAYELRSEHDPVYDEAVYGMESDEFAGNDQYDVYGCEDEYDVWDDVTPDGQFGDNFDWLDEEYAPYDSADREEASLSDWVDPSETAQSYEDELYWNECYGVPYDGYHYDEDAANSQVDDSASNISPSAATDVEDDGRLALGDDPCADECAWDEWGCWDAEGSDCQMLPPDRPEVPLLTTLCPAVNGQVRCQRALLLFVAQTLDRAGESLQRVSQRLNELAERTVPGVSVNPTEGARQR